MIGRDELRRRLSAGRRPLGPLRRRGRGPDPRASTGPAGRSRRSGPAGERLIPLRHDQPRRPARRPGWPRRGDGLQVDARRSWCAPGPKVASADPPAVLAAAKELRQRSFGQATEKYRELGTMANLLAFNAIRRCRRATSRPRRSTGPRRSAPSRSAELRQVARELVRVVLDRLRAHLQGSQGQEGAAWSTRTCSRSARSAAWTIPDQVIAASALCDELGLDTISAGGTIALAMECVEQGLIDAPVAAIRRRRGTARGIDEIGSTRGDRRPARRGLAGRLAPGSAGGPETFAAARQGAGAAGLRPAGAPGDGARPGGRDARGADHNRSGAYEADFSGEPRPTARAASSQSAPRSRPRTARR